MALQFFVFVWSLKDCPLCLVKNLAMVHFFVFSERKGVSCKCFSARKARRVLLKSIKVKEKRVFSGEEIAIDAE